MVLLAVCLSPLARAQTNSKPERLNQIRAGLQASILELRKKLAENGHPTITARDLSNGALALLEMNLDSKAAESWFSLVLDSQNVDRNSAEYGSLPWEIGNSDVRDENSIEFGTEAWGPLLLKYRSKLSPSFLRKLEDRVPAAIVALQRHTSDASPKKVEVSYTNIYLMNSVNLLLLAEAIKDTKTEEIAVQQLPKTGAPIPHITEFTNTIAQLTTLQISIHWPRDMHLRRMKKPESIFCGD